MLRNPRIWIYLTVGLVAAALIGYSEWRDSDPQRLQRCIDASIAAMKEQAAALEKFDDAQPVLVEKFDDAQPVLVEKFDDAQPALVEMSRAP